MNNKEKMDNFRFGFSGIAGFNKWHFMEGNEYGVWENIIRAEQHMNGQDVKNVIGSNYIQGRQQLAIEVGPLQWGEGDAVEMQYYLSEDKNSAVGYVYNRTVNYRTAGLNSQCRSSTFDNPDNHYENFDAVVNFDWNSDQLDRRLKIVDLPNNEYYIFRFYGYPDGDFIESITESTGLNQKIKVKFPTLTQDRAVVWFTCQKLGGRDATSTAALEEENNSHDLIAYPNPTTSKLFVSNNYGGFEVYNSLGLKVVIPQSELNRDEIILDFKGFAKGIYYIHFIESLKTIKICVL
jgi:hypothetical protein